MHIITLVYTTGSYQTARLQAACIACQKKGWNFTVIQVTSSSQEHPWGERIEESLFSLHTLSSSRKLTNNLRSSGEFSKIRELLYLLQKLSPTVLILPGWGKALYQVALFWARRHRVPAILLSESKWDDQRRTRLKEGLKFHFLIEKYSAAIVGGQLHREYITKLGFPRKRVFMGYDVVDNRYFAERALKVRENPQAAITCETSIPTRPYLLIVTRLIERKNVLGFLKAYATYIQRCETERPYDLVICGHGEEEPLIKQFILQAELQGRVHLPGFVTYQSLGDWYGLASALVHPAIQEQWGLVINEACAAGLPVLCSSTIGARYELVREGKNGFLFDPTRVDEMTHVLLKFHQLDDDTRTKMGQLGQEIVAEYPPEKFAAALVQAVETALS